MSYYQGLGIGRNTDADARSVARNPQQRGVSQPSHIGTRPEPSRHMDAMEKWKFDAAYGRALNYRNPDGSYAAKTVTEVKELQAQFDAGSIKTRSR